MFPFVRSTYFFLECLPLFSIVPLVVLQGIKLWNLPHFQFFPIAILFVGWWLRKEYRELATKLSTRSDTTEKSESDNFNAISNGTSFQTDRYTRLILGLYLAGVVIALFALLLFSQFLAHVAFLIIALSLCIKYLIHVPTPRIVGAFSILILCVPMPFNYDQTLIQYLQTWSSFSCGAVLDCFHVTHIREGNIIQLPEKRLFVDEACSGVDSLYSLAAVALAMLIVQRASLLVAVATMLTVPFWAIMGNLIRLLCIGLGLSTVGIDLSTGWSHTVLGLAVFLIVSACHLATALSFASLFSPISSKKPGRSTASMERKTRSQEVSLSDVTRSRNGGKATAVKTWYNVLVFVFAIPITLVGGLTWYVAAPELVRSVRDYGMSAKDFAQLPEADYRPLSSFSFRLVGFNKETRERNSIFGRFSHVWDYETDSSKVITSLDFPFNGWHDLEVCYLATGWNTLDSVVRSKENADQSHLNVKDFSLSRGTNEYVYVMFSLFDLSGSFLEIPYADVRNSLRLNARLFERLSRLNPLVNESDVQIQFQMAVFSPVELTPEQQTMYREEFYRAAKEIAAVSTRTKQPQSQ